MATRLGREFLNRSDVEAVLRAATGGTSPDVGDALIYTDIGWVFSPIPGGSPLVLTTDETVALASGNNNDVEVQGSVLRVTVDAAGSTITGVAGGSNGRVLFIRVPVASAGTLTISDEDVSSAAENRFADPGGGSISLPPGQQPGSLMFAYDGGISRWVQIEA